MAGRLTGGKLRSFGTASEVPGSADCLVALCAGIEVAGGDLTTEGSLDEFRVVSWGLAVGPFSVAS